MPNHNQFKRKWESGDRAGQCSGACSSSNAAEKRATEGFVTRQLREMAQKWFCFGVKSGAAFSEGNREPISTFIVQ
jgi:hypothetical protein